MISRDCKKVAVVTGAGQGLGKAVALALSAATMEVAAVGRTEAKVLQTVSEMSGRGIACAADLTDPAEVRGVFRRTVDELGGVDVLVNCAAEYSPFRLDEATDAQITNMIAQSLTSPLFCMREAIPLLRARGGGDIVNVSTQSVELPQPFMTTYAAAKGGLETMSNGLRYELKGDGIRVLVCQIGVVAGSSRKPGFTELRDRMQESWTRTGIGPMYVYPGAPASRIAAAIVHAVTAPRDIDIQMIKLRGGDAASRDIVRKE